MVGQRSFVAALDTSRRDVLEPVSEFGSEVTEPAQASVEVADEFHAATSSAQTTPPLVSPLRKPVRARNKAHRIFVASHPCLVCQRSPCDAHYLKFAERRALGRKVSDEFTVPLCREHHTDLHPRFAKIHWVLPRNESSLERFSVDVNRNNKGVPRGAQIRFELL